MPPDKRTTAVSRIFTRLSRGTAWFAGRPITFAAAVLLVIGWAAAGPVFHFSATWQLVINTATTIATFLMVFLIQHTQNRDAEAVQVKLAELIRAMKGAENALVDLDGLTDEELDALHQKYVRLADQARKGREQRAGVRRNQSQSRGKRGAGAPPRTNGRSEPTVAEA